MPPLSPLAHVARGAPVKARAVREAIVRPKGDNNFRPWQGSPLPQICSDGTASRRLNILSPLQSYGQNMQEFCQLQKSPQKNNISIRQNDNTLIIKYFLYSQLLSHQVGFLGISGICNISKYPISPIFAPKGRVVVAMDNNKKR